MKLAAVIAGVCLVAGTAMTASADDHGEPPAKQAEKPAATNDHRGLWKGVFASSVAVVVAGGGMWAYGAHEIDSADDKLAGTMDPSAIARYNAQGEHGQTMSRVGMLGVGVGSTVAIVALYKGFIQGREPSDRVATRKHPRTLVVTPIVASDGGGATLRLDW
jgi:hypothetical protein